MSVDRTDVDGPSIDRIDADRAGPFRAGAPVRRAVFITATELEPRRYGKPVVIGGIVDHLCDRLGPAQVHVILVGQPDLQRPAVTYQRHVISKPRALGQVRAVLEHTLLARGDR